MGRADKAGRAPGCTLPSCSTMTSKSLFPDEDVCRKAVLGSGAAVCRSCADCLGADCLAPDCLDTGWPGISGEGGASAGFLDCGVSWMTVGCVGSSCCRVVAPPVGSGTKFGIVFSVTNISE